MNPKDQKSKPSGGPNKPPLLSNGTSSMSVPSAVKTRSACETKKREIKTKINGVGVAVWKNEVKALDNKHKGKPPVISSRPIVVCKVKQCKLATHYHPSRRPPGDVSQARQRIAKRNQLPLTGLKCLFVGDSQSRCVEYCSGEHYHECKNDNSTPTKKMTTRNAVKTAAVVSSISAGIDQLKGHMDALDQKKREAEEDEADEIDNGEGLKILLKPSTNVYSVLAKSDDDSEEESSEESKSESDESEPDVKPSKEEKPPKEVKPDVEKEEENDDYEPPVPYTEEVKMEIYSSVDVTYWYRLFAQVFVLLLTFACGYYAWTKTRSCSSIPKPLSFLQALHNAIIYGDNSLEVWMKWLRNYEDVVKDSIIFLDFVDQQRVRIFWWVCRMFEGFFTFSVLRYFRWYWTAWTIRSVSLCMPMYVISTLLLHPRSPGVPRIFLAQHPYRDEYWKCIHDNILEWDLAFLAVFYFTTLWFLKRSSKLVVTYEKDIYESLIMSYFVVDHFWSAGFRSITKQPIFMHLARTLLSDPDTANQFNFIKEEKMNPESINYLRTKMKYVEFPVGDKFRKYKPHELNYMLHSVQTLEWTLAYVATTLYLARHTSRSSHFMKTAQANIFGVRLSLWDITTGLF